ncbi:nitroreductase family protein [Rugosibacter aromaticivorans]|uniref:nitroreductase family protein n=1 Tax=Rugosibacter aromaticivorans TaxID=1565605 RepID=UPI00192A4625|nr:nitroreductase family protein [Rugosibacter aromaticivorans]
MSVIEAINGRSSVRVYTPGKLDQAKVNSLLAAAVRAPTAVHEESWVFVIVQDAEILKCLSVRAKALFIREAHSARLQAGSHVFDPLASPDFTSSTTPVRALLFVPTPRDPIFCRLPQTARWLRRI